MDVVVKRIYDQADRDDGTRALVDRVWPRGMRKQDAPFDTWIKDVSPSTELRKWYGHDVDKFDEFAQRYRQELDSDDGRDALRRLQDTAGSRRLTLLTAAKDVEHSQATVLAALLRGDEQQ